MISIARRKHPRGRPPVSTPAARPCRHARSPLPAALRRRRNSALRLVVIGPRPVVRCHPARAVGIADKLSLSGTGGRTHAAEFTSTFAERLDTIWSMAVKHAADGDELLPGCALMRRAVCRPLVDAGRGRLSVKMASIPLHLYKPASISRSVRPPGRCATRCMRWYPPAWVRMAPRCTLAEGMGGSTVWSQDQASSVVFGMPLSVAKAGTFGSRCCRSTRSSGTERAGVVRWIC